MTPSMAEACLLCKQLPIVQSHANLYIVDLAIQTESESSSISLQEARSRIVEIARVARETGECVNYQWFEDCCWQYPKLSFKERDELRLRQEMRRY